MSNRSPLMNRSDEAPTRPESGPLVRPSQFDALWDAMADLRHRVDGMLGSIGTGLGLDTHLADIEETDDAYLVDVDLAGVKRSDVEVTATGRRLTVRGTRKEKERVGFLRRRDRTVGSFHYDVMLPGDVEVDEVTADLEDGVLTVRLPKPERDRTRHIRVS